MARKMRHYESAKKGKMKNSQNLREKVSEMILSLNIGCKNNNTTLFGSFGGFDSWRF